MTKLIAQAKSQISDFSVNTKTGEAFISVRKAAALCGVDEKQIRRDTATPKGADTIKGLTNQNIGLSADILVKLLCKYADKLKPQAIKTLQMLASGGARMYIYSQVGYNPFEQKKPLDLQAALAPLRKVCIPESWVIEHFNTRSRSSIRASMRLTMKKACEAGYDDLVDYTNGKYTVSALFLMMMPATKLDGLKFKRLVADAVGTEFLPLLNMEEVKMLTSSKSHA